MKKILSTLIFSLVAGTSHADPHYVFVGMDQHIDFYVDINSITNVNSETISIHKIGQTTPQHESITKIAVIDGIVEIDCGRRINRVVSIVAYDKNGNVVFEISRGRNRLWENVQPGHGENTMVVACSKK